MYIGDIYLPILSNIDKKSVSKITKEIAGINAKEPRTVSIRRNLQPITLEGYLYNDGEKDDAQYAEDVEALQYRSAGYCYTKYADLDGFIEIENAEAPQTSEELGVRNYSVEGKYLPASKYERVVEVETEMRENEFNIEFPPHVALPVGATNVRVKTSQDSVKLSAPAFMAGDIPIYRPFPAFYPDDVTHSTGDTPKYDTTAYKMSYNLLDAKDESISYTMVSGVDVPLGSYRVVLRMKEDTTIASDARIVVLSGDNVVVDSLHTLVGDNVWNIVKSASFNITQRGITYTIKVSKAEADVANLAVNYGFLLPDKRARVAFDVAAEYDVGECKVFDTITTDSEESTWIQVFNPEHDFAGDIVVQNSTMRWIIKQTAWKDATKVYNIFGSAPIEIGKLYNKAFGDNSVAIKFKEIKPNYLKFTFELDTGNATSESTSAKEIDTVEITPFNVVIDKDVIGAYKDHYTFESTPGVNVEYENGVITGIDSDSVYGLIKSVNVTSSYDGDIIETTDSESRDSYVVPFVIPCEITSYLYKQAADLVISKDNNDIERKFWKDDFSVDSSDQYETVSGSTSTHSYDTDHIVIPNGTGIQLKHGDVAPKKFSMTVKQTGIAGATSNGNNQFQVRFAGTPSNNLQYTAVLRFFNSGADNNRLGIEVRDETGGFILTPIYTFADTATYHAFLNSIWGFEITFREDSKVNLSIPLLGINATSTKTISLSGQVRPYITTYDLKKPLEVYEITSSPSESYADDFTTDTTERYQAVTGTVAYDDTNKRMNVTTATGANGKASGRLKSYKFCEGSQIYDVLLPTGADGDFICMVTHATDAKMTNGIGVGLQSDGAGNWNLATLSGTTVTEGADSGLDDADVARIEIEKDLSGAYWYYIYDAAGPKPTTATGKLFTTLTEGYTGWYANGNSKTYAIENISIRAESIVGRTNVEVTEPFWFRDEFGEDSRGRYVSSNPTYCTVADGKLTYTRVGTGYSNFYVPQPLKNTKSTMNINLGSDGIVLVSVNSLKHNRHLNALLIRVAPNSLILVNNVNAVYQYLATATPTITPGTDYEVNINITDESVVVSIDGVEIINYTGEQIYTSGYTGVSLYSTGDTISDLQITGTRIYNKPIHRGAMLGLYSTS